MEAAIVSLLLALSTAAAGFGVWMYRQIGNGRLHPNHLNNPVSPEVVAALGRLEVSIKEMTQMLVASHTAFLRYNDALVATRETFLMSFQRIEAGVGKLLDRPPAQR